MAGKTTESNVRSESKAKAGQPDLKWAVEWLVKQQGQHRAAATLGVNRKTVALALRRERLTGRMNHAVQTLLANLDDPVAQVSGLVESVDEIYGLVDRLTLRVEALENAQPQPQTKEPEAEPDDDSPGHVSEGTEREGQQGEPGDAPDPEREQAGRRFGWRGR